MDKISIFINKNSKPVLIFFVGLIVGSVNYSFLKKDFNEKRSKEIDLLNKDFNDLRQEIEVLKLRVNVMKFENIGMIESQRINGL